MNTPPSDPNPSPTPERKLDSTPVARHGCFPSGCGEWFVVVFLLLVLAGLLLPTGSHVQVRGSQTKALAQAKQIGLALRLFADDHNGNYPRQGVPEEMRDAPSSSNAALACLFPDYTQSESIFGNKLVHGLKSPNNVIDSPYTGKPVETLSAGENAYGYVMGLTTKSPPDAPLLADGTDGTGHYNRNTRARGGVWAGEKAVVVRLDNSGALERLEGPDRARYVPRRDDPSKNLLDVGYLGKDVSFLNPTLALP